MIYEPPTFCHIYFSLKAQSEAGNLFFFFIPALCRRLFEPRSLQPLPFSVAPHYVFERNWAKVFGTKVKKCYQVIHLFTTDMLSGEMHSVFDVAFKRRIGAPQKSLKAAGKHKSGANQQRLFVETLWSQSQKALWLHSISLHLLNNSVQCCKQHVYNYFYSIFFKYCTNIIWQTVTDDLMFS